MAVLCSVLQALEALVYSAADGLVNKFKPEKLLSEAPALFFPPPISSNNTNVHTESAIITCFYGDGVKI